MKKNKVLLIGWDAADWKIIGPLLAKGQMPALKKMIDNGVYGNMSTMNPPYSPMLWSSVATGKTPDKHGVLGFIELMPDLKGVRPVTTNSRKSRALWNIFHNQGYKSNLVGWWPSFPAEPINGVVISDKFQKVNPDPSKQSPIEKGTIHPESIKDEYKELRMFPWEITKEHILPFIPNAARIDQDNKQNGLQNFAKIMAHNVSLHNAATKLLRTTEWDFTAVYYDLIDHFSHSYMRFYPPKMKEVPQDKYELFKEAVIGSYRFQDMMLERKLQLVDDDTTVIVMSDHGFESGRKRILEMPKVQAAPALEHRQFGIFVAMGPNIKKNQKVFGLGLIDVAPTILHHFDLPIGKDMDGKVAMDIFEKTKTPKYIDSWENVKGDFGELDKEEMADAFSDQEAMEQLIELGYIERPDEDKETAILKTKCDLKHNLARVHLGKKNFAKANEILLELIQEKDPIDLAPFYLDLITISLAKKDYESAQKYLEKLKSSKTEVKYNLFFAEAEMLDGLGKPYEALKLFENFPPKGRSAEIWYRIGALRHKLDEFDLAKEAFENAIDKEPDKAKYNRALAETMLSLEEYEEAVEYALTSIELVKYYPDAHYVLGKALEQLGDLKNAKIAFETASKLKPKKYHKAILAKENVEEKLKTPSSNSENINYKYREDQIVVVSGLPRSGTSVMMQMLDKGGLNMMIDEKRKADESNPKGYYEYEPVMSLHKDNSWLKESKGKAIKIVAPLLTYLNREYRYKIIFMKRDLDEVVKSQRKMTGKDESVIPVNLYNTYKRQLEAVENWKKNEPGVELIYINYKDVLENPNASVENIEKFVGKKLDKEEMAKCVDKSLYRNRVEKTVN